MLVTKSKSRDRNATEAELVYLVPELCRATGAFFTILCSIYTLYFYNCYISRFLLCIMYYFVMSHDKPFFFFFAGLTEEMRDNFILMKDLSDYTRVNPEARINRLMHFNQRLRSQPDIAKELNDWNLRLDNKLVSVPARILPQEKIFLAGNRPVSTGTFADWTKELHNKALYMVTQLSNWILLCPQQSKRNIQVRYIKIF